MEIRKWKKEDFKQMIELGEKMWKEGVYQNLSYSRERLQNLGETLIKQPEKGMGFVAVENDKIVGMMIVYLSKYFFSNDLFAYDLFLYIDPDKRKSVRVPIKLINTCTEWAKSKGAKEFRPGSSVGVKTDKVEKLYNFMKFKTIGNIFTKEL